MDLTGHRTYLTALAVLVVGVLARWGLQVDPGALVDVMIIVVPAIMAFMRKITYTPAKPVLPARSKT